MHTTTYILTTGSFNLTNGIDIANWILGGADVAELGDNLSVALLDDMTETITVSDIIGDNTKIYNIAPKQLAFTEGSYATPGSPAVITVTI